MEIPGGLIDKSTEFFSVVEDFALKVSYGGKIYDFNTAPKCRLNILQLRYNNLSNKQKIAYDNISILNNKKPLEQMAMCLYGALNNEPDIDENDKISEPEYVPCKFRGICKHEGVGCMNIMVRDGIFLSRAETEVFKLVSLPDKEIAAKLFLSVLTIQKHFKNIREKTQFANKIEMAIWATKKGII